LDPKEAWVAGKFQVKRTPDGRFQFVLVSATGRVIATGVAYKTKTATFNAIKSARVNAPDAELEDQTTKDWSARGVAKAPVVETVPGAGEPVGKAEDVAPRKHTPKKTKRTKKAKTKKAKTKK
jgi:uncharacterized protein